MKSLEMPDEWSDMITQEIQAIKVGLEEKSFRCIPPCFALEADLEFALMLGK